MNFDLSDNFSYKMKIGEHNLKSILTSYKNDISSSQSVENSVIISITKNELKNNCVVLKLEKSNILNKITDDLTVIVFVLLDSSIAKILGGITYSRFLENAVLVNEDAYGTKTVKFPEIIIERLLIGRTENIEENQKNHDVKLYHIEEKKVAIKTILEKIKVLDQVVLHLLQNNLSGPVEEHLNLENPEKKCNFCQSFSTAILYLASIYLFDTSHYKDLKKYIKKTISVVIETLDKKIISSCNGTDLNKNLKVYFELLNIKTEFNNDNLQFHFLELPCLLKVLKETQTISCINGIFSIDISKNFIYIKKLLFKKIVFSEKQKINLKFDDTFIREIEALLTDLNIIRSNNMKVYDFSRIITKVPDKIPNISQAIQMGVLPPCVERWIKQIKESGPKYSLRLAAGGVFKDMGFEDYDIENFFSQYSNPTQLGELKAHMTNRTGTPEIEYFRKPQDLRGQEMISSLGRRCRTMITNPLYGKEDQNYSCPFLNDSFTKTKIPDIEDLSVDTKNPLSLCTFYFSRKMETPELVSGHNSPTMYFLNALQVKNQK